MKRFRISNKGNLFWTAVLGSMFSYNLLQILDRNIKYITMTETASIHLFVLWIFASILFIKFEEYTLPKQSEREVDGE